MFLIFDYNNNVEVIANKDFDVLESINIILKLDVVITHLSVASPSYKYMIAHGYQSKY